MELKITMETIFESYKAEIITWEEAMELLQDHCDMDTEDAQAVIEGWNA